MWNLLKKSGEGCRKTPDSLEEVAARDPAIDAAAELLQELPATTREHISSCSECRQAAEDLVAARKLFRGVASSAEPARPFFVSRVMAAIASHEREFASLITPWNEVPRYASKLAWITAIVLLAGTTLFYEKDMTAVRHSPSSMAGPESIFEPVAPVNQDDVLISMAEAHP